MNRDDRGTRQRGKGVIEAFYAGFAILTEPFDYIVKLDGDVSFPENYFEGLLCEFASDSQLGIAGGGVYEQPDGQYLGIIYNARSCTWGNQDVPQGLFQRHWWAGTCHGLGRHRRMEGAFPGLEGA